MDLTDDQFSRLGLEKVSDLSGFLAETARTYEVKDLQSRPDTISDQLVIKTFDLSAVPDANITWDTGRWSASSTRDWTTMAHETDDPAKSQKEEPSNQAITELLQFNWVLGENSMGVFTPPILEVGMIDKTPYFIREHFSKSVKSLIETKVTPTHDLLFHLADSIGASLSFLHQTELNVPHGNVKPSNVLISEGNLKTVPIVLCDAVKTTETNRRNEITKDLQSLGLVLLQLVTWENDAIPLYEALNRAEQADYSALGRQADKWKALLCKLLDANSYQGNPDTANLLQTWFKPLRPSKTPVPTIPAPKAPSPAGPTLGGSAEKEVEESVDEEIDERIQEDKFLAAFEIALRHCEKNAPDFEASTFERLDFCASKLDESDLTNKNLPLLETAAKLGSVNSCLRLGLALMAVDRDQSEALEWLQKAADSGSIEALQPLASLYENGVPGQKPDGDKAYEILSQFAEKQPGPDKQYALAAVILRGQTTKQLDAAIPLLSDASEQGFFKATDLLGQVYATGHGVEIDEKKAYSLFARAWKDSGSSNEHYYTASNNLGVCLGLGFGTSQNLDTARFYFQQGAVKDHGASQENLKKMG